MPIKIAFQDSHLGIRGTSVAMYDYSHYNEVFLKNISIILAPVNDQGINSQDDILGIRKFSERFPVFRYKNQKQLESILEEEKCDILYCIKYGRKSEVHESNYSLNKIKTVIHCVFDMSEPHGDIYAGVSKALADKYNKTLYVPHMISLTPFGKEESTFYREKMRKEIGIPLNAIVFGRYGGMDTMNLSFCWRVIKKICEDGFQPSEPLHEDGFQPSEPSEPLHEPIYFLFANTPQIVTHNNIKYTAKLSTEKDKNIFISMCDAYIECGSMGHSFGLAIGEFSVNNKPIIAYKNETIRYSNNISNIWNDSHIKILGDKGIYFTNEREFFHIITTFKKETYKDIDLNCYKEYTPEKVMSIFKKVFID